MPYYKDIDTLFIHIPKTGGSSLEKYLSTKSKQTLHCVGPRNNLLPIKNVSLQHQLYSTLYNNRNLIGVNFKSETLKIISIVRNPYNRLISDLFFFSLISAKHKPEVVFQIIKNYIYVHRDNHNIPQYKFLYNEDGTIMNSKIKIFKTETLNDDLIQFGYKDFKISTNVNKHKIKVPYISLLNRNSIDLINRHYHKDFELFGYEKK